MISDIDDFMIFLRFYLGVKALWFIQILVTSWPQDLHFKLYEKNI